MRYTGINIQISFKLYKISVMYELSYFKRQHADIIDTLSLIRNVQECYADSLVEQ